MATGTLGTTARDYHQIQRSALIRDLTVANGTSAVVIGVIPAGSVILGAFAVVDTAYDVSTNNALAIGNTSSAAAYAAALTLTSVGVKFDTILSTSAAVHIHPTSDITVIATRTMTGSAALAGTETVVVEFYGPSR